MKLLQLNVTANWGSTGKIAEGIGLCAMDRGWESAIAYGRMMNPSKSQLIKVGTRADVYAHYARNKILDGEGLGSRRATLRFIKQIEAYAPDIIHLHNLHDHWINYPVLLDFLKSSNSRVVWTFHDCWPFTGGCCHFVHLPCNNWRNNCSECSVRRTVWHNQVANYKLKTKLIKELGDNLTIISVSRWLDSLVAETQFSDMDHRFIYNGVDTSLFYPRNTDSVDRKYSLCGKRVLLGVSSAWPGYKGLKDYIALRRHLPEDFVIILVGVTASQIKSLPAGIIGIPRTNNVDELAALYSRVDAVLSLSKAETFGLTLVEGRACGTPSIGYADTAIKELLTPDVGIAVSPGNIDGLVRAAIDIADGSIKFDPVHCRETVKEHFDQHKQYNKYIDLYEEILR